MGRPGLTQHRKFRRLTRATGSAVTARGSLELIWDTCYEAGVAYLGDADDVEAAAQWTGEPGLLARSLLDAGGEGEAGFIDELPGRPGHFECHDLYDHAPEYVRKRFDREAERQARGVTLKEIRSAKGKAAAAARWGKGDAGQNSAHSGEQVDAGACPMDAKRMPPGTTPSPSPSPSTDSKESACAPAPAAPELILEPAPSKPARKPAAPKPPKAATPTGPNGYLPEEIRQAFWAGFKAFPGQKATNASMAAKAFAEAVASGQATGDELAGCMARYRATFASDKLQFMTQAHAWLAGAGYMGFLDDERRGKPIPIALGRAHGEALTVKGSGFEDYVMPDYVPPEMRPAAGGF